MIDEAAYECERYKYSVAAVVYGLHAFVTGSGDPLPLRDVVDMYEWLAWRLNNWLDHPARSDRFDRCVYALCEAVLDEVTAEFRERSVNCHEVRNEVRPS